MAYLFNFLSIFLFSVLFVVLRTFKTQTFFNDNSNGANKTIHKKYKCKFKMSSWKVFFSISRFVWFW